MEKEWANNKPRQRPAEYSGLIKYLQMETPLTKPYLVSALIQPALGFRAVYLNDIDGDHIVYRDMKDLARAMTSELITVPGTLSWVPDEAALHARIQVVKENRA